MTEPINKKDLALLILLLLFIVFLAVGVFMVLIDTRGMWYPGHEPGTVHPALNQLMNGVFTSI